MDKNVRKFAEDLLARYEDDMNKSNFENVFDYVLENGGYDDFVAIFSGAGILPSAKIPTL